MRVNQALLRFLVAVAFSAAAFPQSAPPGLHVAPVPPDPLELALGPFQVPETPEESAPIIGLMALARHNGRPRVPGYPFKLEASFESTGPLANSGSGEMEETWITGQRWRWTARLGDYSQLRVFYKGIAYDAKTPGPMPLRLQMVRGAVFWPMVGDFAQVAIRVSPASWNGTEVTCALLSGGGSKLSDATVRQWEETEYCVDPKSGLLQTYSEAPGTYAAYDYSDAVQFHGRTLPRQISMMEGGIPVLRIRIDRLEDAGEVSSSLFTPTPAMMAEGPGAIMRGPIRFPQLAGPAPEGYAGTIQPVIVHATLGPDGSVLEAEAMGNSDASLSEVALELVKRSKYRPQLEGTIPLQREAFIDVKFVGQQ